MTEGADWNIQKAIAELLFADTNLSALIGDRLYEEVPDKPQFPYVVLGDTQEIDDSVQCLDGSELFIDLHVWTNEPGYKKCKLISAILKTLLHRADLTLDEERCVLIEHRITRTFQDRTVIIKHGVVTFRALTEVTS